MAKPTKLPREKILSIAEKAASAFSYSDDFNIERVVDDLGGRILMTDFWEDAAKTGSLTVHGLRNFEIFIPSHTTRERDQFTIAHELGHYILHYLPNVDPRAEAGLQIDRYGDSAIETEANLFAFAFLMPKSLFSEAYTQSEGDLSSIAKKFGVSEVAARVRAKMLGLHGDGEGKSKASRSAASISAA
jgi:Zn-dependent peptidase ImmA (M78 family)